MTHPEVRAGQATTVTVVFLEGGQPSKMQDLLGQTPADLAAAGVKRGYKAWQRRGIALLYAQGSGGGPASLTESVAASRICLFSFLMSQ